MAPSPFRRRKAAKTVRNLAIAEAALALAKDRVGKGSRRPSGKLLVLGGAVAAAGVAALLKRDKVAGLLPSRSGEPEPEPAPPGPPQPSNYDAPGPVANTATPIPAPDPQGEPPAAIDEGAEEAAAAAEAGAIGGTVSDYAGSELGEPADEAQIPLAEAGEGESEGQEQAEAELADNATYRDAGLSDTERRIEDTIEQADQPMQGETPDPLATPGGGISGRPYAGLDEGDESGGGEATADATETSASEGAAAAPTAPDDTAGEPTASDDTAGHTTADATASDETPGDTTAEATTSDDTTAEPTSSEERPSEAGASTEERGGGEPSGGAGGDDEWRTWSGRSVNP
jgi:hypothetical protein